MWGQVYGQVPGRLSVLTSTKRLYRKGTRRTRKNKGQRTNTKKNAGTFGQYPVYAVPLGGIQYRRYLLGGIQCWRYLLGGIESWRYSFGGIESWRYFSAVSRVGGTFLAEAVKPKYGGIFLAVTQYGGNVLAVGGFSFFGGNTLAVGGITKIWR